MKSRWLWSEKAWLGRERSWLSPRHRGCGKKESTCEVGWNGVSDAARFTDQIFLFTLDKDHIDDADDLPI